MHISLSELANPHEWSKVPPGVNLVPPKLTDPIGGAARFATVVKEYRAKKDCLVPRAFLKVEGTP